MPRGVELVNLREATVEILRRLRKADEEAASVGPESQARFERKVAALEVTHSDERRTQHENQKEAKEQGVQAIESAYRKQRADLEQQYRAQHESLKEEATRSLQDGQKQKAALLEAKKEQIWLAETVFESSEDKPGEKFALTASTIRNQCRTEETRRGTQNQNSPNLGERCGTRRNRVPRIPRRVRTTFPRRGAFGRLQQSRSGC